MSPLVERSVLLAIVLCGVVGCAQKLRPSMYGPFDPAGGSAGAQPAIFVKPPYRALDVVNVTGQSPLKNSSKARASSQAGSK